MMHSITEEISQLIQQKRNWISTDKKHRKSIPKNQKNYLTRKKHQHFRVPSLSCVDYIHKFNPKWNLA
jgi:hypothetical protein